MTRSGWVVYGLAGCLLVGCAGPRNPEMPVGEVLPAGKSENPAPAALSEKSVPVAPTSAEIENSIYFRANEARLEEEELGKLRRHAERLKENPKVIVTLIGHTDNQGSRSYKLAIADERVRAVFRRLLQEGVPRKQLRRYPAGKEMNRRGCETADCQTFMRRVELVYSAPIGAR